jgi:hypothetical protein
VQNPQQRFLPGQPPPGSARAFNGFAAAARGHSRARVLNSIGGGGGEPVDNQRDIVLVLNSSGANVDRFGVLGVDVPIILPTENLNEFENRVALSCVTPTADHSGRFVVMLEPIANTRIGKAFISGVCVAQTDFPVGDEKFADVFPGNSAKLRGASQGAQVLWKQGGTGSGLQWTVIRLGAAASVPTGEYRFMSLQVVAQSTNGFDFERLHPMIGV